MNKRMLQEDGEMVLTHYDRHAELYLDQYGWDKRHHFAQVSAFMNHQGQYHPKALAYKRNPPSVEEILESKTFGAATNLLECARRADGAICVLVCSPSYA